LVQGQRQKSREKLDERRINFAASSQRQRVSGAKRFKAVTGIVSLQSLLIAIIRFAIRVVRLPLVALLALVEPVIRAAFSLAMVLGILAAVVFEISAVGPRFPFQEILTLSLGCGLALIAYYGLLSLITR